MPRRLRQRIGLTPFHAGQRQAVIDTLVTDQDVVAAARAAAVRDGVSEQEALARVAGFAQEIVPHFDAAVYHRVAYGLARRVASAIYRVRMGYVDRENLGRIPPEATVIFVMNHRSNFDYILVAYLAARHVAISYAVGEWARVWPLDTLIRNLGGFFVRRRSQDALYRKVLERYVQIAVSQGVVQALFPEGKLSRDGRLSPAKVGLIAYGIRRFDPAGPRDIVFVPVGINYDRVIEDRTLLLDLEPDAKRPGPVGALGIAAWWMVKHARLFSLGRLYRSGYACVNFGTPRSLRAWLAEERIDLAALPAEQRGPVAERLVARLMDDIARLMPLTPVSVVALALVNAGADGADRHTLSRQVQALLDEASGRGGRPYIPRKDLEYFFDVGLRMLTLRNLVVLEQGRYRVAPGQEKMVAYYANSIIQFFEREDQEDSNGRSGDQKDDKRTSSS